MGEPTEDIVAFLVQGSAEKPYRVVFFKDENTLTAHCTCPAGSVGQYCKHRFNILSGLTSGIVSDNIKQIHTVKEWLIGTEAEQIFIQVKEAETQLEAAQRHLHSVQKKLGRALRE